MGSNDRLQQGRRRRAGHLIALEPRMMFDAAAAVTAQALASPEPASSSDAHPIAPEAVSPVGPAVTDHAVSDHAAPDHAVPGHAATMHLPADAATTPDDAAVPADRTTERSTAPATMAAHDRRVIADPATLADLSDRSAAGRQIIFIDTAVAEYRTLAAEWASRGTVVLIDASRDGIDQVRAALAGQTDIAAIHIVSHGAEGVLWLGTTRLDAGTIAGDLAGSLGAVGRSLAPGGDILLYGCDFAEGTDGAAALQAFAQATHADIAASTNLTGDGHLGGDWTLEAHTGTIEARALTAADWHHLLDPNTPVPIAVQADSLTVTYNGRTVVTGTTGYGSDARSPDVGQGAVARWTGAATYQGQSLDLVATVTSLSAGDAIRFNRPTASTNGGNPTFLLRDLTTANAASAQIQWQLVLSGTNTAVAVDVEFGILDIDGIGGKPFTRESVSASTAGLSYYSREKNTDIYFQSSLDTITASGTQDENTDPTKPLSTASEATFDWKNVSSWTLTYTLATNSVTTQAQFYQDGNFDFHYTAPVYTSIPRLDLDANDSTASGNDAHFTFTEKGPPSAIVDSDVAVSNPMDINSVIGGVVKLTNAKPGDALLVGTLPGGITATTTTGSDGTITVTLSGTASESVYAQAFRAVTFTNTSRAPDTTQRVIEVSFSNDTLTSAIATSRIDVIAVNDPPERVGTLPDRAAQDANTVSYATAQAFSDPDGDTLRYTATGLPAGLSIDPTTGVIAGTIDRSASQANGGRYAVTVTATDPSQTSATQTFTLAVTNPPPIARDDTASTSENTPVTVAVLANDSDPDGNPLTVTAATAQHGTVVRNADGTLTYTPTTYFYGSDTINYTISDGQGGTSSATVAVTVAHVNQPPQPSGTLADRASQDAATVSYATAQAFSDPDGDALHYTATGLPAGLSIDPTTGVIAGTIDRSASQANGGRYAVTVTATDPSGLAAAQRFPLAVTNPPPVAVDDPLVSLHPGATRTIAVLANDSDPDGDPLTVVAASALHGSVAINPDGTISYTAATGYTGSDTISYTISDGQGGTASARVPVTIGNAAPIADPLPDQAASDAQPISLPVAGAFHDADGDALTYAATGLPAGLTIDPATGIIAGTIDRSASQANGRVYVAQVTASDGHGGTVTAPLRWTVANPPPVARDDTASTSENMPVTVAVLANDSDPDGDPLTVTAATAQHGSVVRNTDGTLTYTPSAYFYGSDTISYTISDGQGGTSSATVAVTVAHVNRPPQPSGTLADRAAQDATTVSYATAQAFSDPDGDTLRYTATGLPVGLTIDPATGVIAGTIDRSASQANAGRYAVTVTATDPSQTSATQTFTLAVTNPPPVARDDTASTSENTPVTVAVLTNDSDPDGDPLTVIAATAQHGSVVRNADGTLTYTPTTYFYGTDTISYTISDGQGGTSSATVAVTVAHVNQPPQPSGTLAPQQANDGGSVTIATAGGFTDVDGDRLTYAATGLPAGLTIDPATGVIGGRLGPAASAGGPHTITVTASDPSATSASQTFTLAVAHPAPVAANDSATTAQETPVTIAVLANDSSPSGAPLRVTGASARHGTVTVNPDATLTYTPAFGYRGGDTIHYTVGDGQGGSAAADVAVAVTPVNHAPVATAPLPPAAASDADTVRLDLGGYFADRDGDRLTYAASGLPAGLAIDPATGVITGTLGHGASGSGPYHVLVTATDPAGASVVSGFDWTIVHPVPIARDDAAATAMARPVGIAVLANDSDPAGGPLTVLTAGAAHGSVAIGADGTLLYTPAAGFSGQDVITYTVGDADGGRASASVLVTVTPPPVAQDGTGATVRDGAVTLPLVTRDPAGLPLTVTAVSADHGAVAVNPDGSVTYVPGPGFTGTDIVRYTVTDANGGTASALVTVTVAVPDRPPVVPDRDPVAAVGGRPVRIDLIAGVTDPDGDPVTLASVTAAVGSLAANPDGTVTYTPPLGFAGTTTIAFTVSDGRGGVTAGTLIVRVADGRGADIEELLRIGRPPLVDPSPAFARVTVDRDGEAATPLTLLRTVEAIRPTGATVIGARPVTDAVNAVRDLHGTAVDPDAPIAGEVARLDRLADRRGAAERLTDRRRGDFLAKGLTGFSAASDPRAGVMIESVVRGSALYVEVRDTADGRHAPVRSIDVRTARGGRPDWIRVDRRGLAIIERPADADELHLVVLVTRADGRTSTTPIVIQGASGEIELDRAALRHPAHHLPARPLDAGHAHPHAAIAAEADRLARSFE